MFSLQEHPLLRTSSNGGTADARDRGDRHGRLLGFCRHVSTRRDGRKARRGTRSFLTTSSNPHFAISGSFSCLTAAELLRPVHL